MANIYVRSTDGSDADSGATWALAKATLAGADAIDAAGDTIYVSQSHAESAAGAVSHNWSSTLAAPSRVLCANDGAEPPTALATTGSVTRTGNGSLNIMGNTIGYLEYIYGLIFTSGSGASGAAGILMAGPGLTLESCDFIIATTDNTLTSLFQINTTGYGTTVNNCRWKFGAAGQGVAIAAASQVVFRGGSIISGSSSPSSGFIIPTTNHGNLLVEGMDLSNFDAGVCLVNVGQNVVFNVVFRNCKLPASWSGTLTTGTFSRPNQNAAMYNCDSGDTNYTLWTENAMGSVKSETTIIKTGGASDGTTGLSWKMASTALADVFPQTLLVTPEFVRWNETLSSITVTVDIIHDSVTNLKDDEVWLEVQYLGTSGFPLGSFTADSKAGALATAADQTASTATWTNSMTNPNKQKLSVTITPAEKGFLLAKVYVSKASYTLYVDPLLQVS